VRLDPAALEDQANNAILQQISPGYVGDQGFQIMHGVVIMGTTALQLVSQLLVLVSMIRREPGGYMFSSIAAIQPILDMTTADGTPTTGKDHFTL
jgi:hypothetical protein